MDLFKTRFFTIWLFGALVLALSLPFWWVGALAGGQAPDWLPINLPLAALMTFNPGLAALVITGWESGGGAAKALLARCLDGARVRDRRWWTPAVLLFPGVLGLAFLWTLGRGEAPVVDVGAFASAPVLFALFLVGALGEELGWQGFAYERLAPRLGALPAALGLGVLWALWHVVPLRQAERATDWIVWHATGQVLVRVILTWIYLNTGRSVLAVAVCHALSNVSEFLVPNYGSSYDPAATTVILTGVVLGILAIWGPNLQIDRAADASAPKPPTLFEVTKRWLYAHGRPNPLARWLNAGWAAVHAWGVAPNWLVTLEVVGRRSGRVIRFPLVMAVVDGERYLASMLGPKALWVQNVAAAEGRARLLHGKREAVRLVSVPVADRAPVLKAYLQVAPGARPHVPIDKDAPLEAFAAIAEQVPVYRVEPWA